MENLTLGSCFKGFTCERLTWMNMQVRLLYRHVGVLTSIPLENMAPMHRAGCTAPVQLLKFWSAFPNQILESNEASWQSDTKLVAYR